MGEQEKVNIRNDLIDRLTLELVGPNYEDEEIGESPSQRYLTGILWPNGTLMEKEDDEKTETDDNEDGHGTPEAIAPLMQAMKPSSIGLSFVVEAGQEKIRVFYEWGEYFKLGEKKKSPWKRTPIKDKKTIDLMPADGLRRIIALKSDAMGEVNLEWLARPLKDGSGRLAVSLFLVNRREKPDTLKDAFCLYQPLLKVKGYGCEYPFSVRKLNMDRGYQAPDVAADNLLYRKQRVFAVGHGVAVDWNDFSNDEELVGSLFTKIIPVYEIPRVIPPDWLGNGSLDMKEISKARNGDEIYNCLNPMLDEYEGWIEEQGDILETIKIDLDEEQYNTGEEHLRLCKESLKRMRKGLGLIRDEGRDREVFRAFCFANRVMSKQRIQSIWARKASKTKNWSEEPKGIRTQWRPFQIAFILQSLTGIVEPDHDDRKVADLLWFPTGGGKTEAYLGLSAFVMALRRLRKEQNGKRGDAGVTILMRYTLRLLTIQQFQRAATLICACEMERIQDKDSWGEEPFRIGLWVGSKNTPNDFDESVKLMENEQPSPGAPTPVQLVSCPWCGSELHSRSNYFLDKKNRRILIGCSRRECEFHRLKNPEGIPAVVTDEEIYRLLPTLLIGTVDKFARLPWVGETQSLFGKVKGQIQPWGFVPEGAAPNTQGWIKDVLKTSTITGDSMDQRELLPPELVIQDELHLISGPLGTMVGLYETAIDYLCSGIRNGVEVTPKVVASTATIRRAKEQIQSLFARSLSIFPSPALDSGNSYFAVEQPTKELPGRNYVGIFAPGRSVKTALVRVYAALLSSTGAMKHLDEDLDPYQTLVGYFNSLRELGGAVRLIEDDVRSRMSVLSSSNRGQKYQFVDRKLKENVPELTSRVDSSQIPALLQRLEQPFHVDSPNHVNPVDVVFASNMISVGVDVSRLGLMVVTGQPKTTAEYIQATSRVGREHPGLVITVYNWARPRDVSHYERFGSYHAALYRYVEAISVTPFSSRARDRALSAVLVSMTRLSEYKLSKRETAKKFRSNAAYIESIMEFMRKRLENMGLQREDEVEEHLKSLMDKWESKTFGTSLTYTGGKEKLLYPLGEKAPASTFSIPNSMRDVESSVGIYLLKE
ncbi:DISARM system helicase DrmA [Paenibacillus sp. FSL L8-0502]|uniref:DISARM system helicase DrmA n=1 Tax=Paenibacillus sp. FSL L8-0502 TaxID=2954619 RepID=UPI0031591369